MDSIGLNLSSLAESKLKPTVPFTWMSPPTFRGTSGIVTLCLSTMGICVWSSIHKDITTRRSTSFQAFISKVRWMLMALFVPPMCVMLAVGQYRHAKRLQKHGSKFLAVTGTASSPGPSSIPASIRSYTIPLTNVSRACLIPPQLTSKRD